MKISFDKYQGAGNDFIMLDNRSGVYSSLSQLQLKKLCDRNYGIGADGIILVETTPDADFKMNYFNSDGNPSSLCGNGSRCTVAFANRYQMIGDKTQFKAIDGLHEAQLLSPSQVRLHMQDVNHLDAQKETVVLDTGSPHYVQSVEELSSMDVKKEGAKIRYSETYGAAGINVNFLEKISDTSFAIRTYERGVENETLACGTGAVAGALAMHHLGETGGTKQIEIHTLGGILKVEFNFHDNHYNKIYLEGPATFVFSGSITL